MAKNQILQRSEICKKLFLNNKGIAKSLAKNRRMLTKKTRTNPRAKTVLGKKSKNDIIASQKTTKRARKYET